MSQPRYCGLLRRLGAVVYDSLILSAVLLFATAPPVVLHGGAIEGSVLFRIYLVAVAFLFFGGFWTYGGQTLGMKAWGIRLRASDGSPVNRRQALLRFVTAGVSWLALGAGYLWCLVDRQGLAWHDRLSDTRLQRIGSR
jgi:uncharacterized RDD family membrane protein YckC